MSDYKTITREQNSATVDKATHLVNIPAPKQGWIKTVRLALGMSGTLLSQKLKGHRSTAAYLERAEQEGSITINKLRETAAAMGCDLIYGLVPKETARHTHPTIEDLLFDQADQKAKSAVRRANMQMALESQHLSEADERHEVDRVRDTLLRTLPKDFWVNDPHTNRQE